MNKAEKIFFDDDKNFVYVLRALFDPKDLAACRAEYAAREAKAPAKSLNERAGIQGVAPDALRLDKRWYEPWLRADLDGFLELCQGYDQMTFPPQLRHVRKTAHFVPWHQDIAYQLSMGPRGHSEVATCFVPIDENPAGHTTLEFALAAGQAPRPHKDAGVFQNALEDARFERTVSFELDPGDALFFGALIPHRTYQKPEHVQERYSLEFRITRKPRTIKGKDYLDLRRKEFYVA